MEPGRLLVADDDPAVREIYTGLLSQGGHEVHTAVNGDQAIEMVRERAYDLLLTDLVFPPTDGVEVLKAAKRIRPTMLVVVFSGYADVTSVLNAFRNGAFDFLEKPVEREKLLELARRAVEVRGLGEQRRRLAEELESERLKVMTLRQQLAAEDPFQRLIGGSTAMQGLLATVREVARTDSTVLLTGESGTGKGLVARTIHEASVRRDGPFVEANCVVYSEGVLHSELFGHERGAFTGADRTKKGRFELARAGTLFLDEIGEISQATQLLLLRVLQERTFERVGGEETHDADVRLVAATNRDLQEAIGQGTFRSDLFYRLNVIPVHLPPLREHPEDIPLLARHFLDRCCQRTGRGPVVLASEALEALVRHPWPGNVRELENAIERVVVLDRTGVVELTDLPPALQGSASRVRMRELPGTLQAMERARISEALGQAQGNKKLAARRLGIHRSTLYAKMRRYGLAGSAAPVADESREERQAPSDTETPVGSY
jgi:two-component system response regulator HydG